MWEGIDAWWKALTPPVQAAVAGGLITGIVTLFTATVSVGVVMYQLRKQRQIADRSARRTENLKLKKEIYLEILKATTDAWAKRRNMLEAANLFKKTMIEAFVYQGTMRFHLPAGNFKDFLRMSTERIETGMPLIRLVEHWEIVAPSISKHREALRDVMMEADPAQGLFILKSALTLHRLEEKEDRRRWEPPSREELEDIYNTIRDLEEALNRYGDWIFSFERDMQNALLGELFDRKLGEAKMLRYDTKWLLDGFGAEALVEEFEAARKKKAEQVA
jgi:hypothetical protein